MNKKIVIVFLILCMIRIALSVDYWLDFDYETADVVVVKFPKVTLNGEYLRTGDELAVFSDGVRISSVAVSDSVSNQMEIRLPAMNILSDDLMNANAVFKVWRMESEEPLLFENELVQTSHLYKLPAESLLTLYQSEYYEEVYDAEKVLTGEGLRVVRNFFKIFSAPANLSGHSMYDKAFLRWDEPVNSAKNSLEHYLIYRKLSVESRFSLIGIAEMNATSFVDSLLQSSIYNYKVVAVFENGYSLPSEAITLRIDQVSPPMFSHGSGFFQTEIMINMFSLTRGAMVFYTIDGSIPDSTSIRFWEPFTLELDSTLAINAIALKCSYIPSQIMTRVFTTTGTLPEPIIIQEGGLFEDSVRVSFVIESECIDIRYTFDTTEVIASSALYSEPFYINRNSVLRARAFKTNWISSDEIVHEFKIVNTAHDAYTEVFRDSVYLRWAEPLLMSNAEYNISQREFVGYNIYIKNANENSQFERINDEYITESFYSTAGLDVGEYKLFIQTVFNENIVSESELFTFSINKVSEPISRPLPGLHHETLNVTLHHDFATIRYTLDGSIPNENSSVFRGAFRLQNHSELSVKFRAFHENYIPSEVVTAHFQVTDAVRQPAFSHSSGFHSERFILEIFNETEGAVVFFTTDGTEPDSTSRVYVHPLPISETTTIRAIAKKRNWRSSEVISTTFDFFMNESSDTPAATHATRLMAPFPNPFNQRTSIPFSLEKSANVEIEIFNLLGQKIVTLTSGRKEGGEHLVSWNGRDENGNEVAGGVYFCRMQADGHVQMVKLIFMK